MDVYKQCVDLQKSGTSATDTLKRARELFRQQSKSGTSDFQYEHCWILVRDHPRWVNRSSPLKPPTLKRIAPSQELKSEYTNFGDMDGKVGTTSEAGHDRHEQNEARRGVECLEFGREERRWPKMTLLPLRRERVPFMSKLKPQRQWQRHV